MIKLCAGGGGLGDAVYMRAVAIHLIEQGEQLRIFTRYPEFFSDLSAQIVPSRKNPIGESGMRMVGYDVTERLPAGVDIFKRICRNAGVPEVELRMEWRVRNTGLIEQIKRDAAGRPIFVYQPRKQINPTKPWSRLARPRREAFMRVLEKHANFYRIKLGHPPFVPEDRGMPCELDLWGRAFIYDTFDVLSIADLCFSQPSFINAAAEALDKKYICMFARAAVNSQYIRVSTTTPEATFHKRHLATAMYDD